MGHPLRRLAVLLLATATVVGCSGSRPEAAPEPAPAPAAAPAPEPAAAEAPTPSPAAEPVDEAPAPATAATVAEVRDAGADATALYETARVDVDALAVRDFSPEDYWTSFEPVLAASPERFRVQEIGSSIEGRPIRRIDFGRGTETVLLWSQMHGNESTASRSLVDLVAYLDAHPDDPRVGRIEERLAVTLIPVLNPDGAARFVRHNAVGIDINRDARRLATPEGRLLKSVRDEIDAAWGFNLHDQSVRTRLGDSGRDVLIALLAPPPGPGETSPANRRARRMCSLLSVALAPAVGDQVARYDESFNPRAFGDLMAAWGTSTILIESGGELSDPHKERLRKANFVALLTGLDAIATGAWEDWGEERYFALPLNFPWVNDLVVRHARIVLPDAEPVVADMVINFADTLKAENGRIEEIGDLAEAMALREIDAEGLFYLPDPKSLDGGGALRPGALATGVLARDREGREVVYRLRAGLIEEVG